MSANIATKLMMLNAKRDPVVNFVLGWFILTNNKMVSVKALVTATYDTSPVISASNTLTPLHILLLSC